MRYLNRPRWRIMTLCAFAVLALPLLRHMQAQPTAAAIQYGETVKGTLAADAAQDWAFVASSGDQVSVSLARTSGDLRASLTLQDQDQQPLVSVQASNDGQIAVSALRIGQPGAYTLHVQSTSHTSGDYTLTLTNTATPDATLTPLAPGTSGEITNGATVQGALSNQIYEQFWHFKGAVGDVIDLQMHATSGDLVAYISLISPGSQVITTAAGINGKQDAGIFSQQLVQAGTYTVIARRAGDQQGKTGQTSGAYDLTLTVHTVAPGASGATNTTLALDATISGRLTTASPVSQYQIVSGGVIALQVALVSTHRIARARILDSGGTVLITREGSSPLAFSLTLPDKGPFFVQVSSDSFDAQKSVDFALSAFKIRATAQPLRFFETQHGSAGSVDDRWFFTAHAGDLVRLNVTPAAGLLNTSVVINGPQDVLLFQGTIGPRFDQPFTLPADGLYQVTVQSGGQNATPTAYTINASWFGARGIPFERFGVSQSKGIAVLDTPVTGTLSADTGGDTWAFDALANQAITVSVSGQAAVQPLGVAVRAPDDTLLGVQYGTGSIFLQNVLLPRQGRYHLIVFDPSGAANNTYTLQVENSGGGVLPVGQPVKGVLLPTNALAAWTLDVPAGALINAQLTTRTPAAWTPGLYVLDPSGMALTRSTVNAQKDQVSLLGVSAPVAGRYRIVVAGTVAAAFASYELRANVQAPFANGASIESSQTSPPPIARFSPALAPSTAPPSLADLIEPSLPAEKFSAPDVQLLPPNTLLRGEIAPGALRQVWHLVSQTGTTLAIRAVALSGDNGPDLLLLDRDGKILVQQLHGDTTDTNLTYRVVQAGDYTLSVRMGLNSGRYTLYAQAQTLKNGALTIAAGTPIVYGQSISGEIRSADQSDAYYFYGAANDVIGVQTIRTVGDLVPSLQIVTPAGTALAVNSNKSAGSLSTLQNVRLPQEGVYAVIVRHSDSTTQTSGRYLLALQVISGSRLKNRLSGILSPGQTVSGALVVTDNTNTWLIKGRAGERLSLVASALQRGAEPTPLGLRLMDTAGTTFASQDVFLPQDSARLMDVMLPADGIYRVQVIGGGQTPGGYQLTWLAERSPLLPGALRYGQTVGGVFTTTHNADTWVFAGTANDVISISLSDVRGTPFRGGFQVLSANGVALATAADLGDGSGARVDNLLLPFSGSYRLIIANSDAAFQGTGVYGLSLVLQDSKARALGAILHDGEQGAGDLYPDTPGATWLFSGRSGDVVNVRLEARDQFLKPMLTLQNAFGQILTTASASPTAPNAALINGFKLPADGVYALLVSGTDKSTGSYQIGLDFVPPPVTALDTLQYGANVVGLVANDRPADVHLFNGRQGDHVSAKVTREPGSQLATVLELRTLQGDTLIRSDALGQDNAVIDDFVLPATGTYRLVTTRYLGVQGITTGRFTLALNGTTPPVSIRGKLIPGQSGIGRLDDATPADHWTFDGKAGEVISITSKATSGDLDTFLTLQTPEGSVLATNDDFDGTNAVLSGITLPVDGLYSVTLSRVGEGSRGSSGNYDLRADDLYTLGVAKNSAPQALISYGQRVVGTLDPAHTETRWTFAGNQGDVISVQIAHPTDDAPPMLALQDPTGAALASGQLGVGQTTIDHYRLPARGFFDVVVKRPLDARKAYSPYALTLILDSSASSATAQSGTLQPNGVVIGSLASGQSASLWLFSGSAGQTFSLELLTLTGNLTPSVLLVDPGGQALVTRTLAASKSTIRFDNVPLALSGVYTVIVVPGATDQGGTYRLTTRSTLNDTPPAHALMPDQNVQGTLDDIHPTESWQIQARKGQTINVQMLATGGDLQPSVQITSADGQILTLGHLDRTLIGSASAITAFAVPADGMYQLVAARSAAGITTGSGTYALTYSVNPLSVQTLMAAPIRYGQTVQNVVPASQNGLFLFSGKAGDAVNLIALPVPLLGVTSTPTNVPALTLQDAGGRPLAHADPSSAEANIQGFVLPGDGRYIVTLAAGQTTPYLLTLQRRQDVLPAAPGGRILVNGVTQQNGILDKNLYDYWMFSGKADSVIQIAATQGAGNLRMDVTLYSPNGYLASATADASTHALTLGPLRLPASGTYQVVVGRWLGASGKTTGRYSLLLSDASGTAITPSAAPVSVAAKSALFADQAAAPGTTPGMVAQGEIAPGGSARGFLDAAQIGHVWTFNAEASPTIAVTLQSESAGLQVKALIIDANGSLIGKAQSDTAGVLLLEAPLPAPGRYTVVIMPGAPGQSGSYRFALSYALSPTGGGRLVSGEAVTGTLTTADFTDIWHFVVPKGALITVQAMRQSGDLALELALIDPDGAPLSTPTSTLSSADGTYQLIVTRHGGATGTTSGAYQLRVIVRTPTF